MKGVSLSLENSFFSFLLISTFLPGSGGAPPVYAQTYPNSRPSIHQSTTPLFPDLHWRFVGPFRGGWATMAVGIPEEPEVFYLGAAGGGVWKTTDAGQTWQGLMQHEASSSVGAIDVAPSNPNVIYVGTGQVDFRWDISSGDGVYKSDDGGESWNNVGLKRTLHIGRILIDPADPQRVLVAALGNIFAPNTDRGVYLTTDGGKNWQRVLYVNDSTGAVDLAFDPLHPSVIYAALWQMQMHPWLDYFMPQIGQGSGIYKSSDAGAHWTKLEGGGLPDGLLGRIGLGVARGSGGQILYSTVIAREGKSGLYRSNDEGKTWDFVNKDADLANNYFSRITVDPNDSDMVYVMDRSIQRSNDGGKNFEMFKGAPGGDDYHYLWINPSNTSYMITLPIRDASSALTAEKAGQAGTTSRLDNSIMSLLTTNFLTRFTAVNRTMVRSEYSAVVLTESSKTEIGIRSAAMNETI